MNNTIEIHQWKDLLQNSDLLNRNYENGNAALLLGNGASIAISDKFNYKNLYGFAKDCRLFLPNIIKLFEEELFKNKNFENMLEICEYAARILDLQLTF